MRYWLKELREEKKMTHQDVASASDISRSYYTLIESGVKTPAVEVAKDIAKVLGFQWTKIFEDKSSPKEHSAI